MESDDQSSVLKRQFKTAEIADAVLGTDTPIDPSDIESLYPKNVKDFQTGFSPPCDEKGDHCGSSDLMTGSPSVEEEEEPQQVNRQKYTRSKTWTDIE